MKLLTHKTSVLCACFVLGLIVPDVARAMQVGTGFRQGTTGEQPLSVAAKPGGISIDPARTYVGLDQPVLVSVGSDIDALTLIDPLTAEERAEVSLAESAHPGVWQLPPDAANGDEPGEGMRPRVDLAALFSTLRDEPPAHTVYVQAWSGGRAVGAPLVVQPMRTPERVELIDPGTLEPTADTARGVPMTPSQRRMRLLERGLPAPPAAERTFSGYRVYPLCDLVMSTTLGQIRFRLRPEHAPNTCWRIMELVRGGFYTGIEFHRVVADIGDGRRFVAQVGDPTGTGFGGSGEWFDFEASSLAHRYGVLSVARWAALDSGGSQLFVCLGRAGTRSLDGRYCSFAEAIDGGGAIEAIASVEVDDQNRPTEPPVLISARLEPAAPFPARTVPLEAPGWVETAPAR